MLSEHDWTVLGEVERQLRAEDPEFTRSFATNAQRLQRGRPDRDLIKLATVGAVLLAALMLVAGSAGGALAFAAVAGLIWWARAPVREHLARRDDANPRSTTTD